MPRAAWALKISLNKILQEYNDSVSRKDFASADAPRAFRSPWTFGGINLSWYAMKV